MKRMLCVVLALMLLPLTATAEETLRAGAKGQAVEALQNRLIALELLSGSADGLYGQQTAAAVEEAQRLLIAAGYGLSQTGEADAQTLALLDDGSAESALRTLRAGSKGSRVRAMQNRLIDLGFLTEMADGAYGSQTASAVSAFQREMETLGVIGPHESGVAGPETLQLLELDATALGLDAPICFDDSNALSLTPRALYAPSCILLDAPTGRVLFEKDADARMYPASTTKMVTLLLALTYGGLDKTVTIPACAANVPSDSSLTPVVPGQQMTMSDLLHGMMIRSGNDAANAVAELCGGSVEAFVEEMNAYARRIGMDSTHFCNPHGYHDPNHYTTARDLATAARLGLTDPTFAEIVTCLRYTLPQTDKRKALVLENTYAIFQPDSPFFIPGAAGVKSGYTRRAGFCYVGAAQRDGHTLIAVLLHVPGRDRTWTDLRRLFEYGFALLEQP